METLMNLVGEHSQIMDMINDPEVDQQTVPDTLEGIEGAIEVKADGYGYVLRGIGFERAALAGKKAYLKKLLDEIDKEDKRLERHETGMKERFTAAMIAIGKDDEGIKTDQFEFKLNTAGGVPKLEIVSDKVPEEFKKKTVVIEDDKEKIREYVKTHDVDWAWLLPKKRNLVIKGV